MIFYLGNKDQNRKTNYIENAPLVWALMLGEEKKLVSTLVAVYSSLPVLASLVLLSSPLDKANIDEKN